MARFVLKDTYYNKAKQEGFRARSAYKLQEIQSRFHSVRKGDRVLDLGCAPGSWLQLLSGMVGGEGTVTGIDILPTPALPAKNITTIVADIRKTDIGDVLSGQAIDGFDVVTCDIAPNLSGIREVDDARIEELFGAVLQTVEAALKTGGSFIIKSFFTGVQKGISEKLRNGFAKVSVYKPAASRSVSSEVYYICQGKKVHSNTPVRRQS